MRDRLEVIARGMLRPINPYATLILGVMTMFWGLFILAPGWNAFGTAKLFSKAIGFAPEWAWGVWSTICGALIILAVLKGYYVWLARSLGFAVWHWFTIAGMLWWGDWKNTGGINYTFIAIYALYAYLNIKINYVKFEVRPPKFH
jgi:hypothetical protein